MADPLIFLDTCSEEQASWTEAAELDADLAVWFVRRAQAIARGYVLACRAGRGELAVGDVMGSLTVNRRTAEAVLGEALCLVGQPATVAAVEERRLGLPHVRALLEVLIGLPGQVADQVEAAVLADLVGRSPARVRELARRHALRIDPDGAAERRRQAARKRKVSLRDVGDGMVSLSLLLRAEQGLAILHRAEQQTAHDDGSGRTRDQRRVDWIADTLLTEPATADAAPASGPDGAASDSAVEPATADAAPASGPDGAASDSAAADGAVPAAAPSAATAVPGAELVLDGRRRRPVQVLVHVPVTTALGIGDEPGELAEIGPIDAAHGRLLLSTAELRKVCVDATTGQVLHVEERVHRPTPDPARERQLGGGPQARAQALAEAVRQALLDMVHRPSVLPVEDEPGYRPSAGLSRTVKTRHPRCDFLTCSTSSRNCDDEHTIAWPRGATSAANVRPRSRTCHRMKQRGWTPTTTHDGSTLWTSPSGRQYPSPAQHHPPPAVPADANLPPPRPPEPRDDGPADDGCPDADLAMLLADVQPAAESSDEAELAPPADPADPADPAADATHRGWPDEAPF